MAEISKTAVVAEQLQNNDKIQLQFVLSILLHPFCGYTICNDPYIPLTNFSLMPNYERNTSVLSHPDNSYYL